MADPPRTSPTEAPQNGPSRNRRRFYRATTRLRFRVTEATTPPRVWMHREGGEESALYRPDPEALARAWELVAAVPRRTINLSEGGMRVRYPEEEPDRGLVQGAGRARQARVHVLLAFGEPGESSTILFQLPARVVRVDELPWARFLAFAFYDVPGGLRQRLEGEVLAVERRRLRRNLMAYGTPEAGEDMAARLKRLEAESGKQRHRKEERDMLRNLRRQRRRFFP